MYLYRIILVLPLPLVIARVCFTPTYNYENPFYYTILRIASHLYPY